MWASDNYSCYALCLWMKARRKMESCKHHGQGCSPEGSALYKCAGYFEHSFSCEHYVCESHVHRSRYGTFCDACYPSPPVFAMPKAIKQIHHLAGRPAHGSHGAHQRH
jgi:hypothetical protein